MNAQQILDNMVEEAETPLFLCRHYELECESEEKAGEGQGVNPFPFVSKF